MTDAEQLGAILQARGAWIAVAESLTAGLLQAEIASVSGASRHFAGGLTAYTLAQKVQLLGVDREHAAAVDCVSVSVARQMAAGVAARFGTEVAAATTGYAEPWGDVREPYAHYAIQVGTHTLSGTVQAPGCSRRQAQNLVVATVMRQLVITLASW